MHIHPGLLSVLALSYFPDNLYSCSATSHRHRALFDYGLLRYLVFALFIFVLPSFFVVNVKRLFPWLSSPLSVMTAMPSAYLSVYLRSLVVSTLFRAEFFDRTARYV